MLFSVKFFSNSKKSFSFLISITSILKFEYSEKYCFGVFLSIVSFILKESLFLTNVFTDSVKSSIFIGASIFRLPCYAIYICIIV